MIAHRLNVKGLAQTALSDSLNICIDEKDMVGKSFRRTGSSTIDSTGKTMLKGGEDFKFEIFASAAGRIEGIVAPQMNKTSIV